MSPTQRTLAYLRAEGYTVAITEHWNQWARRRVDLWGFVDVLALRENETLAVQCTSDSNVSARVKKIADHENIGPVRKAGWKVIVMGWKAGRKEPRIVDVS